jgi:hypothetical protein
LTQPLRPEPISTRSRLSLNNVSDHEHGQLRYQLSQLSIRLAQSFDFFQKSVHFRPDFGSVKIRPLCGTKTVFPGIKFRRGA